ncbi:MAG: tRNA pseudouridine(38-40) synthase TruA [Desulfovibrionaceae bacterium]
MPRIRLTVAYIGTRYSGWQIQEKPHPPLTIQGELERVVRLVVGDLVRVHGSGRTDAGVHADAQIAHMDIPENTGPALPEGWLRIFNTNLPDDISVLKAEAAAPEFHSRFDAVGKAYTYQLWTRRFDTPPRLHPFVWPCGPLDLGALDAALPYLTGCHDFASLQNAGTDIKTTVRTVHRLYRAPEEQLCPDSANVALRIEASGFLKQMVRNITGVLVAIGRGRLQPEDIPRILATRKRSHAPITAPAKGLTLREVFY